MSAAPVPGTREWPVRARTLGEDRVPGDDNALPLRHLASLMVIWGHGYTLAAPGHGGTDRLAAWLPGFTTATLAVYVFFAISGYLVMLSLLRRPGFWPYLRNRALRILPAYWVQLVLCALVLGPVFTTLPVADYLGHAGTLAYLQGNAFPLSFVWDLPGVFQDLPYPRVVNGSLWSLGLEMRWYGYLGLLLLLGAARRRWAFTAVALAFLGYAGVEWLQGKPDPLHYRALSCTFVAAALAAHWRHRIRLSHALMLALVVATAACRGTPAFGALATATVLYASGWIVYALPVLRWPAHRDYSYGLFLYGFPCQQAVVAIWPGITPAGLFFVATGLAALLAALSWHLVESPALRWKAASR
ncbi:acyltransferase family protein [Arenimonas sp. MALMAid1274]|uniref:acyltransferase family protein n=1 Tax=Arenimonas sp. MALMAid1274 TaxID=3411630 RepID=UPI003BA2DBB8